MVTFSRLLSGRLRHRLRDRLRDRSRDRLWGGLRSRLRGRFGCRFRSRLRCWLRGWLRCRLWRGLRHLDALFVFFDISINALAVPELSGPADTILRTAKCWARESKISSLPLCRCLSGRRSNCRVSHGSTNRCRDCSIHTAGAQRRNMAIAAVFIIHWRCDDFVLCCGVGFPCCDSRFCEQSKSKPCTLLVCKLKTRKLPLCCGWNYNHILVY